MIKLINIVTVQEKKNAFTKSKNKIHNKKSE
jgi:hypothetical protein